MYYNIILTSAADWSDVYTGDDIERAKWTAEDLVAHFRGRELTDFLSGDCDFILFAFYCKGAFESWLEDPTDDKQIILPAEQRAFYDFIDSLRREYGNK